MTWKQIFGIILLVWFAMINITWIAFPSESVMSAVIITLFIFVSFMIYLIWVNADEYSKRMTFLIRFKLCRSYKVDADNAGG